MATTPFFVVSDRGPIAQSVEHRADNAGVTGAIPVRPSTSPRNRNCGEPRPRFTEPRRIGAATTLGGADGRPERAQRVEAPIPVRPTTSRNHCQFCLSSVSFFEQNRLPDRQQFGPVAQLGERLICIQEVSGSIPLRSTSFVSGRGDAD